MSLRGVPKSRDDAAISALLCQSPLTNVILSLGEESRYLCTYLSTGGRDKSEGDLQMGSLEHPLRPRRGTACCA